MGEEVRIMGTIIHDVVVVMAAIMPTPGFDGDASPTTVHVSANAWHLWQAPCMGDDWAPLSDRIEGMGGLRAPGLWVFVGSIEVGLMTDCGEDPPPDMPLNQTVPYVRSVDGQIRPATARDLEGQGLLLEGVAP